MLTFMHGLLAMRSTGVWPTTIFSLIITSLELLILGRISFRGRVTQISFLELAFPHRSATPP